MTVGTVFERSKVPLDTWLYPTHLLCSSKKGISSQQLARMLGVTVKTELAPSRKSRPRKRSANKKFVSLVERGGRVCSRNLTGKGEAIGLQVRRTLYANLHPESVMHTDGAPHYKLTLAAAGHEAVDHNKEFARTTENGTRVHTNSAEGFFSIFKRGLVGTYQHMSEQHLQRYLCEFDFRMNYRVKLGYSDDMRADIALQGIVGKRLMYRRPEEAANA